MNQITIADLEVFYCVGVTEEERSRPQRLLLSVTMETDFRVAARSDRIEDTVDYFAVTQDLLGFGEGRSWCLLERLASEIADRVLTKWKPDSVAVEVKKFVIPQAQHVSVAVRKVGTAR